MQIGLISFRYLHCKISFVYDIKISNVYLHSVSAEVHVEFCRTLSKTGFLTTGLIISFGKDVLNFDSNYIFKPVTMKKGEQGFTAQKARAAPLK